MKSVGHLDYVANSYYTVPGDAMNAGCLYDMIGDASGYPVTDKAFLDTMYAYFF